MGAGRKTIPNELKKLRGTDQPCRMRDELNTEKVTDIGQIVSAKELKVLKTKRSKQIFKDKANQLIELKLLTELDYEQLALYAHSLDVAFECIEQLAKNGKFVEVHDENGILQRIIENPYLKLYNSMISICVKIGSEFGFTPVSRMKLSVKTEEKDPFIELLSQYNQHGN